MNARIAIDTIHGIRTDADEWGHVFASWMEARFDEAVVNVIDWGCILAVQMYLLRLIPFWERKRVAYVADRLRETGGLGRPHSIVAHSFGTYLAVEALWRNPDIMIDALVFMGSVLGNRFGGSKLEALIHRGQVNRVLNFWSRNDTVIRDLCVWPYGKLGATGFVDMPQAVPALKQLQTTEQHSTYFWREFRDLYFREIADFIEASPTGAA